MNPGVGRPNPYIPNLHEKGFQGLSNSTSLQHFPGLRSLPAPSQSLITIYRLLKWTKFKPLLLQFVFHEPQQRELGGGAEGGGALSTGAASSHPQPLPAAPWHPSSSSQAPQKPSLDDPSSHLVGDEIPSTPLNVSFFNARSRRPPAGNTRWCPEAGQGRAGQRCRPRPCGPSLLELLRFRWCWELTKRLLGQEEPTLRAQGCTELECLRVPRIY